MPSRISTPCFALLMMGLTAGLVSCRGRASGDDRDERRAGAPAAAAARAAPVASTATQRDLAGELDRAEAAADPDAALDALVRRWRGVRLTWTVTRQPALCRDAAACHVVPFPVPAPEAATRHGWLPVLGFAAGQFDRLIAACGDTEGCDLTFAGELAELVASPDLPTSLRFANVELTRP